MEVFPAALPSKRTSCEMLELATRKMAE